MLEWERERERKKGANEEKVKWNMEQREGRLSLRNKLLYWETKRDIDRENNKGETEIEQWNIEQKE